MEWALHVRMAAGEMSYLYGFGDAHGYRRARVRLPRLLDSRPAGGRRARK